jgi:hypothetical protein
MRARIVQSINIVLELLISIIQTVWKEKKNQVASLFLLDISGAFLIINYIYLITIIKKLGFLK